MDKLTEAVKAVEAAKLLLDQAQAAAHEAQVIHEEAIKVAKAAHDDYFSWVSSVVPGIGQAKRVL